MGPVLNRPTGIGGVGVKVKQEDKDLLIEVRLVLQWALLYELESKHPARFAYHQIVHSSRPLFFAACIRLDLKIQQAQAHRSSLSTWSLNFWASQLG
jgi:hypothetical protein